MVVIIVFFSIACSVDKWVLCNYSTGRAKLYKKYHRSTYTWRVKYFIYNIYIYTHTNKIKTLIIVAK